LVYNKPKSTQPSIPLGIGKLSTGPSGWHYDIHLYQVAGNFELFYHYELWTTFLTFMIYNVQYNVSFSLERTSSARMTCAVVLTYWLTN